MTDKEEVLKEIRDIIKEIQEALLKIDRLISKELDSDLSPPEWEVPRIFIWYEIYKKDGIVDRDEFHRIGRLYKYDPRGLGGFFVGKEPSLEYVGVNKNKVVLEDWAAEEVKKYKEWIEKNIDKYQESDID